MTSLNSKKSRLSWKLFWTILVVLIFCFLGTYFVIRAAYFGSFSNEELEFESEPIDTEPEPVDWITQKYGDLSKWTRPQGPFIVGIQVGHWQNSELPDELERLRGTSTGTRGGGMAEWEAMLVIAQKAKELLAPHGIIVDLLPATIPPAYWADAVIAIHADGNPDSSISGFKIAAPRRNMSGKNQELFEILQEEYAQATGLGIDPNITRNMRGYYAFNWRRYEHATHPMAPTVILETGFLTNPQDQKILIRAPERAAEGIANAILRFFNIAPDNGFSN